MQNMFTMFERIVQVNERKQGIIVDNFAGGGGVSHGIERATGRPVEVAINHDPSALAMHEINHPFTKHYCENVWDVDPVEVANGRVVEVAWFSPDCKHHSKARGGKPREKHIRGLAWVAVRWAATVKPKIIILENVEEFQTWGPLLIDGTPDPKQKGRTFNSFVNALRKQGYVVEYRELRACDYGAPTTRNRFFLIARCDGLPIVWPTPTHGDPNSNEVKSGKLKPWRNASEIIDWTIPCKSIFGRKKPLAVNTIKRITKGIDKFVIKNSNPFILQVNHSGARWDYCNSIEKPLSTITSRNGYSLVTPVLSQLGQTGGGDRLHDIKEPLSTIVSKQEHCLATPLLTPCLAVNTSGHLGGSIKEPIHTITTGGHHALVAPTLIQYHTETSEQPRCQMLDKPVATIDSSPRYALTEAFISKYYGGTYDGAGSDLDEPIHTITSKDHNALATVNLCILRNNMDGKSVDAPISTITTSAGHFAEQVNFLTKYYGKGVGQKIDSPIDTITSKDRFGIISAKIIKVSDSSYFGNWNDIRNMLNTYCNYNLADDEVILLKINNIYYFISDIGFRMLEPRELFNGQGFSSDYIIDFDINGKSYSKKEKVARCGNSVPPQLAEALIRANAPELCLVEQVS